MQADSSPRVVATDSAIAEIRRLRAEHGPLMFFQSGGCCDGSSPMCFRDGELLLGPNDLLLGEVDGCPFHIDTEQYQRWNRPAFLLDVAQGSGSAMSLEEKHAVHFILASPPATDCAAWGLGRSRAPVHGVAQPSDAAPARLDVRGRDQRARPARFG